jgi:hypothetical protein
MPDQEARAARQAAALERLREDGYLEPRAGALRTTRSWQSALARAAAALFSRGEAWLDLRLPIAAVLVEAHPDTPAGDLAELIEAMLPIEEAELAGGPAVGAESAGAG